MDGGSLKALRIGTLAYCLIRYEGEGNITITHKYEKLRTIIWTGTRRKKGKVNDVKFVRGGRIYADKMENSTQN